MADLAIYPTDIIPDTPIDIKEIRKTKITELETGREFRRTNWLRPKREITLKYSHITADELKRIYNFYHNMKGPLNNFIYFHFTKKEWEDEYIGRAESSKETFELPVKLEGLESFILKRNGERYSDYILTEMGEGRDNITIMGISSGDLITCDFKGYPALKMRFKDDEIVESQFAAFLSNIGITLVEIIQ